MRKAFVGLGLLLVVDFLGLFGLGRVEFKALGEAAAHASTVAAFDRFISTVKDAETGQRGYLLTGEPAYLEPYKTARAIANSVLDRALQLGRSNGVPSELLEDAEKTQAAKFAELDETLDIRREQGFDAALRLVKSDRGKALMDHLRSTELAIDSQQNQLEDAANQQASLFSALRTGFFALGTLLCLVSLYVAYRRVSMEALAREAASADLRTQKQLLEVTLKSIGDGVIVTDAAGNINFLNQAAVDLTGWLDEEARGRPCADVFNIINEDTRLCVDSPVDKVIQTGATVGLANHTLLIRKDLSEIPIDDSGAPIMDGDGRFYGVVLVFRDFSEHKTMERNLEAAKEEAISATNAKDRFIASLSHELRTPLTPVIATLSAWKQGELLPVALRDDLEMIQRGLTLETRLIDDLLDLTRISQNKLSLNRELTDVHVLLQQTIEMSASEIRAFRISLDVHLDAKQHYVLGDAVRLQQAFWNVLRNALKFTGAGGKISVTTSDALDGRLHIAVQDTGIGMTQAALDKVFAPFEQGEASLSGPNDGLGLGLAITQSLLHAHEGTIRAFSDGPNKGSTFVMAVPVVNRYGAVGASTSEPEPRRPQVPKGRSVLLVEDHADTALVFESLLTRESFTVSKAHSVAEATKLSSQKFDVAVADLGLPDGSGLDFLRAFRAGVNASTPAIALSGYGMEDVVNQALGAGFDRHLTKPVEFHVLLSAIEAVLG